MSRSSTFVSWLSALRYNLRFYVLATSILVSFIVFAWLRQNIVSDQLLFIRSQQIYGLISVLLIYVAVILTPLSKLLGKNGVMSYLLFARRAIGVSAAYFALLHIYIAFVRQSGGFSGIALLPGRFKVAFLLGILAFIILFLMAATSFDKAIERLTFKRWKLLHRFIYGAGLLIILHVWMIGTHIVQTPYKITAFVLLTILFGLEAVRISKKVSNTFSLERLESAGIGVLIFVIMMFGLVTLPDTVSNYHSRHHEEGGQHD